MELLRNDKRSFFVLDGLKRWAARKAVGIARNNLALVPRWMRHSFMFPAFWRLVHDYYRGNPTVYACMALLQDMIPEPQLQAWQPGTRNLPVLQKGHAIRDLVSSPNPGMGEVEFWQYVICYAAIGGNAYIYKRRSRSGRVVELWPFHDGQITPVPGKSLGEGMVKEYTLDIGEGEPVVISAADMIHWKWKIDPSKPWMGMGALVASSGDVATANEMRGYVFSMLKNDATPPFAVTLSEGDEFTEGKAKRLRAQWKQSYGGANRGTPAFLEFGMVPHKIGMNFQELDAGEMKDGPDSAICMGFRIQPVVLGAIVGLRYSSGFGADMAAAYKALATFTLVPIWRSLASEMRQGLRDEIGFDDSELAFDLSQVRALQESESEREERLGSAFDRGGILRSEYREGLGFESEESDEVYKESLAIIWVRRGQQRELNPGLVEAEAEGRRMANGEWRMAKNWTRTSADERGLKNSSVDVRMDYMVDAQRGIRGQLEERLRERVGVFFAGLGITVEGRLANGEWRTASEGKAAIGPIAGLPAVDDLLVAVDFDELERELRSFAIQIMSETWGLWNVALNVDMAFDLTDPGVAELAARAGAQVVDIRESTLRSLRDLLELAAAEGWDINQIAQGMGDTPGIGQFVEQVYAGRDVAIARTELGFAQNGAAGVRYKRAGVRHVKVYDNGFENSHEFCRRVAGSVVVLGWMERNLLQHPRCVRAFAPEFDYEGEVWTEELGFGLHL